MNPEIVSTKALIMFNKKFLLFLRDNDPNILDPDMWSLVGGEIDEGESHKEAMEREMFEEIGVVPKDTKYLGRIETPDGNLHAIYVSKMIESEVEQIKIGNEGQKVQFFKAKDIVDLNLATNVRKYFDIYGDYIKETVEKGQELDPFKLNLVP